MAAEVPPRPVGSPRPRALAPGEMRVIDPTGLVRGGGDTGQTVTGAPNQEGKAPLLFTVEVSQLDPFPGFPDPSPLARVATGEWAADTKSFEESTPVVKERKRLAKRDSQGLIRDLTASIIEQLATKEAEEEQGDTSLEDQQTNGGGPVYGGGEDRVGLLKVLGRQDSGEPDHHSYTTTPENTPTAGRKSSFREDEGPLDFGYTRGKWVWQWEVLSCQSGISIGVCDPDAVQTAQERVTPLGGDPHGWAYRSSGTVLHGGVLVPCDGGYGAGDIIGVELDIDRGSLHFLRNGYDVGSCYHTPDSLSQVPALRDVRSLRPHQRGLRPCVALEGPGDSVRLLGLCTGPGKRKFSAEDDYARDVFEGIYMHGLRHGQGTLRYRNTSSYWRGAWFMDMQHGVQLWVVVDPVTGQETHAKPFIFDRDAKIHEIRPTDPEAAPVLAKWRAGTQTPGK